MLTVFGADAGFTVDTSSGGSSYASGGGGSATATVTTPTPTSTGRAIDAFIQKSAINPAAPNATGRKPPVGSGLPSSIATPFYKKWPFWAIVGGVVIVGGGYAVLR